MSNKPVTDIILQVENAQGFYRRKLMTGTVLTLLADSVVIKDTAGTFVYPRADYAPPTPVPVPTPTPVPVPTPTPTPVPTPSPTGKPPALSGIEYTQTYPLHPDQSGGAFGSIRPVGGIGPFSYYITGNLRGGTYGINQQRGWLFLPWAAATAAADEIEVAVVDGRKVTVTRKIQIAKQADASKPLLAASPRHNRMSNAWAPKTYDLFENFVWDLIAVGPNHWNPNVTEWGGGDKWSWEWGQIHGAGWAYPGPPGDYEVAVTSTSTVDGGKISGTINLHFDEVIPPNYIEFTPPTISTSTLPGLAIGRALATTPNNSPFWTLVMDSGLLSIGSNTGVVTQAKQATAPGDYPYAITVGDGATSYTQQFVLSVKQGTTLPADNMTIPNLTTTLTNFAIRAAYNPRPVGNPQVSGFPDPSKVTWFVSKTQRSNYNFDTPDVPNNSDPRGGIGYRRFNADPATGAVTANAQLSAGAEWFELTATDGIYTCTQQFTVQVAETVGPVIYVGQGMSDQVKRAVLASAEKLPAASAGYEHLRDIIYACSNWEDSESTSRYAGASFYIVHNPDLDYYARDGVEDWGAQRKGLNGPLKFIGVPGPPDATGKRPLPRLGGWWRNPTGLGVEKSYFICNHGDFTFKNLHMSHGFMGSFAGDYVPGGNNTTSLIRQNSGMSGDITIDNCDLHDADVIIECGLSDGQWTIRNTRLTNGAGCTSRGGANQHNAYIGMCWNIIVDNVLSFNAAAGHVFKCRAANGTWTNSRFFDGERGSGFNALDLPSGGNHTIRHCEFEKAPMSQNPLIIQYGEEEGSWVNDPGVTNYVDRLQIDYCTFHNHHMQLEFVAAVNFAGRKSDTTGAYSACSITNCRFTPNIAKIFDLWGRNEAYGHDFTPTMSGNTTLTSYPSLDFTSPVSYDYGRPWWHNTVTDLNRPQRFPRMGGMQIDPGTDDIRIPASSAVGAVVCKLTAYGTPGYGLSGGPQPDPNINPFVPGSKWEIATSTHYTGTSWDWTTDKFPTRYAVTTNADGTGALTVGAGGLGGAGIDFILLRCTNPSGGRIVENPFYVVKT